MKTDLRKKAKNNFQKDFFKSKNNAMENVKKHRYITLNYLTSKPNYRTAKYCKIFYKISISNRNKKTPRYLGTALSIQDFLFQNQVKY